MINQAEIAISASSARLGDRDFQRLAELIEAESGIRMPPIKRTMVEGRLRRRLRALGFQDFGTYCEFIFTRGGLDEELTHLIDAITTNKTEFFRERAHFDLLSSTILPALVEAGFGRTRPLKIWSAGSSMGCEAYTLAMVIDTFDPRLDYRILATDICTDVLAKGQRAVYPEDMIDAVPMEMRKKYLLRSKDPSQHLVRIVPDLRSRVFFRALNFMSSSYDVESQDIVFCRNVLIYFDRATRQAVLERICRAMPEGGTLFTGHSEHLTDLDLPVRSIAPTVYARV